MGRVEDSFPKEVTFDLVSKEQRRKDTALQLKFRLTCVHVFMGEKAQMKSSFCLVPLNWLSDI